LNSNNIRYRFAFGYGFEVQYKNACLYTQFNFSGGTTKKDFYFEQLAVLPLKSNVSIFIPELSFGYKIINTKSRLITPFAGISAFSLNAPTNETDKYPQLKNKEIDALCYQVGINCDFDFNKKQNNYYYQFDNKVSTNRVRLRLTYMIPSTNKPELQGNQLFLTVGWALVSFDKKRSY
jgi:hypothetical protein